MLNVLKIDPSTFDIIIEETIGGDGAGAHAGEIHQTTRYVAGSSLGTHPSDHGPQTGDDIMLAEIDLFNKISQEAGFMGNVERYNAEGNGNRTMMMGVPGIVVGVDGEGAKNRPWSARSGQSFKDMFLSSAGEEAIRDF
jgi:hypothetical protein